MQGLEQTLEEWRDWPVVTKPTISKKFTQGLNHETVLLKVAGEQLVLKRFLTEPARQIESQLWAASLGISPEIIFAPPNHHYMLMEALAGDHLSAADIDNKSLQKVAQSLSVMHNANPGPRSTEGFNIVEFCRGYLDESDCKAIKLHGELLPALNAFLNDPTPWTFCHNDLVEANCFITGSSAQFIDWEYADLHNPWFDLAAIIYYFKLSDEQTRQFLNSYSEGWAVKVAEPIFYASQIALLWGDMLWHLHKFGGEYWAKLEAKFHDLKKLAKQVDIKIA